MREFNRVHYGNRSIGTLQFTKALVERTHLLMFNKILHKLTLATVVSSAIISTAVAQAAETFSIDNMALNTNNLFGKLDNEPKLAIYTRNDSDFDQQFDRMPGNQKDSFLLKHRSTSTANQGKCLNAHYIQQQEKPINVWKCDATDADQNWNLLDLQNGYYLIKLAGTNLCIDTPTRKNGEFVHLWTCDSTNPNQRWLSSAYVPVSGPKIIIRQNTTTLNFSRGQQWITYTNYKFIFQPDGNLVLYNPQGKAIWATGTFGTGADLLAVQTDGNVVLYDHGKAVWATNTWGHSGDYFAIQPDGNVVVYDSNNRPLFDTGTYGGKVGTFTASANWLNPQKVGYFDNFIPWSDTDWENQINSAKALDYINTNPNSDIGKIYRDLTNDLFGQNFPITGAYISDDYYRETGGAKGYHGGIDIAAPLGTPVKTLVSGKVVVADDKNWGLLTIQDANGINHMYMHLSKILVSLNKSVTAGQVVANTGNTGADNSHLHYEIDRTEFPYGALQIPAAKTKNEFRQRTYNPLKDYWQMKRKG